MTAQPLIHTLSAHPLTPCRAVQALTAAAHPQTRNGQSGVLVQYLLQGDTPQLRIPPPVKRPEAADDLWRHTCFEAFIHRPGESGYREFNLSPSGQWAAYAFSDERVRHEPGVPTAPLAIAMSLSPQTLALEAWLPLPEALPGQTLKLGLSAVIETLGGCRTWSADSENGRQRGQFSRDLQAHSLAMGQKDREKWTAAAHLQPAISKSDSLLEGHLSYWALHHPDAKPDFHRKTGWTASFSTS
ncbi:DOMON-like domain-containing protein [Ottowia thiooxydans]|uniref:DOMON-like domain-containing protein n=1 Tax=Ottowia thiooxydans TaxID=219182 RepID=UPI00040E25FD|nr:DOMON-like domain-containing protein [Ottowia thiooxydans]